MRVAILRSGILLALAALGTSAATAQTELFFATGVDSTGWALAQSNADGHVLIKSPQYPRGLWLHLVDEAGDALAGLQVEYQGRPDSLVAIRCVDPAGEVQETLVWIQPDGTPLHLTLKPSESTDLPAGIISIDWQIDPSVKSLLELEKEIRLIGWEAVAAFLRERGQGQAGRVTVQIKSSTTLTTWVVGVDHPEAIETLLIHLRQTHRPAGISLEERTDLYVQVFRGGFASQEGVILYLPLFADVNLERAVRETLGRPQGRLTPEDVASLKNLDFHGKDIHSLAGIEYLIALRRLSLSRNQIVDLTPIKQLNLYWLALDGNQIVDLTPLKQLNNLQWLYLDGNQIEDLAPLVANSGLGKGDSVNLQNNPLSDQARNEQIPTLQARGVDVRF